MHVINKAKKIFSIYMIYIMILIFTIDT